MIEVLSPEGRMSRMQPKLEDYANMGCNHIWLVDPWRNKAFCYAAGAITEVQEFAAPEPEFMVSFARLFGTKN